MLRDDTGLITWVLTDGKAGDELQALSVTEALGLEPEIRRVAPKPPFSWFMPWGPIDPRERPGAPSSPLAPPFPDLLIGSGRRAVAYLRYVKRATGGRTYTVFLKDPRTGLVDFRSVRDGRVVYLCWRLGEDRIRYWHDLDAGFAGRQPLD